MLQRITIFLFLSSLFLFAACSDSKPEAQAAGPQAAKSADSAASQSAPIGPAEKVDPARAMQYVKEQVAFGRRAMGTPGHKKVQEYIKQKLQGDPVSEDTFKSKTPKGEFEFTNYIVKYPGTKDGIIVLASHYDTKYSVKNFVGANDGGSSTGLLLEIANHFRGKTNNGPAIWLVFFDGEEAINPDWSDNDSDYGSRHLASVWQKDGTAKKVKAFILLDMIGDKDLNIDEDTNSNEGLRRELSDSAKDLGYQSYFFARQLGTEDDHTPFLKIGIPCLDIIDFEYGYDNVFWHTADDTVDKLSTKSLQIVGDVALELVRRLSAK